jgi:hypothetical protein
LGHAVIRFNDDTAKTIDLGGGSHVVLYGQSYRKLYVGSNGYITFDTPDSAWFVSLAHHFSQPRISTLYVDLDWKYQGTVSWWRLSDRVVVSFVNVAEFGKVNSNTFQTEMFYDGRIRLSWLQIDAESYIAGLSEGDGSPIFTMSDFSSYEWDSDKDGIPNEWENQYFGGTTSCNAGDDPDGDGRTNLEEYICGTHPLEKSSVFTATGKTIQQGETKKLVIGWASVEGREYTVRSSDSLSGSFDTVLQSGMAFPANAYTTTVDQASTQFFKVEVKETP